jgi:hypothetical protein
MSLLAAHDERKRADSGDLPSGVRTIRSTTWRWFLALEALFALVYFPFGFPSGKPAILGVIPWMEWSGQVPAWALIGLSSVAAIAYGIRRNRPNAPLAWWFIGAGVLLFITGDTTYKFWHQIMGQQNIPFPSFIDAIYITMYPVLAVGLLLLARARVPGGDRASLIDSVTITLGIGLLSWIFLIGPNVRAPGGMLVRLTAAGYPLGDILVLAMLAHLWRAASATRQGACWRSGWWARSSPTPSTAWSTCTRAGTGTTATRSTSVGSSSTPAGGPRRCTRPCGPSPSHAPPARRARAAPGSCCSPPRR